MKEQWISIGGAFLKGVNYFVMGLDYSVPPFIPGMVPTCPVCGKTLALYPFGGFMEAYQTYADAISGNKPERVCLNMKYPNPNFNPNKKMQREPKFIPCPNNYKFEWNPTMKMIVPRTKDKNSYYRGLPGFPARKVTKT